MWNLATVLAWSDLIHVTLRRNYGFLHSCCNFSKSNAFGENFIKTKFILHKIFFRMSLLSSRKPSRMFFNLCWKNCEKQFVWGHDHFEGKGRKNFLGNMTIFQGMGCWTTNTNITFSMGNGVPNKALIFFPQKSLNRLNESQKTSFGGTFSPYQWFYWTYYFKKKK